MSIEIKTATRADLPTLIDLGQGFYRTEGLEYTDTTRSTLSKLLDNREYGLVLLVLIDGVGSGYAVLTYGFSLEYGGRYAFIDEIYIIESKRGGGIGGQLVRHIESLCRSQDFGTIHLEVDYENTSAQRLYSRLGFTDHGRFLMSKELGT